MSNRKGEINKINLNVVYCGKLTEEELACEIIAINKGHGWISVTPIPAPTPSKESNTDSPTRVDMTAKEFYSGFNLDFLTEEERETIYTATEMFAMGKVRQAANTDCSVEEMAINFGIFLSAYNKDTDMDMWYADDGEGIGTTPELYKLFSGKKSSQLKPVDCSVDGEYWKKRCEAAERMYTNHLRNPKSDKSETSFAEWFEICKKEPLPTPPNTEQLSGETKLGANSIQNNENTNDNSY